MILQIFLLLIGFVILIKSADWLVDGASALAKKHKVSDLAIGLTIVAFGTSAPELVVNIFAANQSADDIVFGNIIGSNNFNLFMILGIAGIISPLTVQKSTIRKEIPFSLLAIVVLFLLTTSFFGTQNEELTSLDGIILLLFFIGFLFYVFKQMKSESGALAIEHHKMTNTKIWIFIIVGLAGLIGGGHLVVTNAISMATALGVSQKIIGLTIVAIGTSLPELATSVVAAMKKNNDIAVGNIVGSNIFNIFLILGVSSVINPITYNKAFDIDLVLLTFGTLLLIIAMFTGKKKKLDRWEAIIFVLIFTAYTVYLIMKEL